MTPKEKAQELVYKFRFRQRGLVVFISDARSCALICASESLKALMEYGERTDELQNMDRDIAWWSEVENEINKL